MGRSVRKTYPGAARMYVSIGNLRAASCYFKTKNCFKRPSRCSAGGGPPGLNHVIGSFATFAAAEKSGKDVVRAEIDSVNCKIQLRFTSERRNSHKSLQWRGFRTKPEECLATEDK